MQRKQGLNVLSNSWEFRMKYAFSADGTEYLKHKSKLVTRGSQQQHGVDYKETFPPVVKFPTLIGF